MAISPKIACYIALAILCPRITNAQLADSARIVYSLDKILETLKEDSNKVILLDSFYINRANAHDYNSALKYAVAERLMANRIHFKREEGIGFANVGRTQWLQKNYEQAIGSFSASLQIRLALKDTAAIGRSTSDSEMYMDQPEIIQRV